MPKPINAVIPFQVYDAQLPIAEFIRPGDMCVTLHTAGGGACALHAAFGVPDADGDVRLAEPRTAAAHTCRQFLVPPITSSE